ncbi:DUF6292 family protein [Goodfellowiella coeruleoviolacea]|uniref:DUF6292 domain-containing protein n=1 Tax=Goodfellowiella coeruleoviolacea TaxID=334858 RepID=A0AAE3GGX2_9PSEU|nr:DUF6292 family protein [Goodfellowiella coeruleoviolacea]MCP2168026.1 hypothetical protein [Goodfellowiella coeruleoviolacea]
MTQIRPLDTGSANGAVLANRRGAEPVPRRPRTPGAKRCSPDEPLASASTPRPRTASAGPTDVADALTTALARYVRTVAEAVGVSGEGTTYEVTDTATAYLALDCRAADHPNRDVMLVWSAAQGWAVSIETTPTEPPLVLSRSTGDLVPAPEAVARFVTEAITRRGAGRTPAVPLPRTDWFHLAERMEHHAPVR